MCARKAYHSPLFWRVSRAIVVGMAILIGSTTLGAAQEQEDSMPCIVLARPGELYDLELNGKSIDTEHTITFSFDHQRTVVDRLEVESPYQDEYDDSETDLYYVSIDSTVLCAVWYVGLESVLLGEERVRLEMTSTDYHMRLVGNHVAEEASIDFNIPESFRIVLALCSLVPFFLLIPDAVEDLQVQLEAEAASKGVYGRILALLLPLLSIALTLFLLEGLDMLW